MEKIIMDSFIELDDNYFQKGDTMAVIKIRCNGKERHVNEIDLDALLDNSRTDIYRGVNQIDRDKIPPRIVIDCTLCDTGKVIIQREIILENINEEVPDERTER